MDKKKIMGYVAIFFVALCLGAGLHASVASKATPISEATLTPVKPEAVNGDGVVVEKTGTVYKEIVNDDGTKFIVKIGSNSARLTFVFAEPVAPDFFVGSGSLCGGYEIFLDDPQYDPLNIGVDHILSLVGRIRQLPGVTEDVYARGYELVVYIAESHLDRTDEIIDAILDIINEQS